MLRPLRLVPGLSKGVIDRRLPFGTLFAHRASDDACSNEAIGGAIWRELEQLTRQQRELIEEREQLRSTCLGAQQP